MNIISQLFSTEAPGIYPYSFWEWVGIAASVGLLCGMPIFTLRYQVFRAAFGKNANKKKKKKEIMRGKTLWQKITLHFALENHNGKIFHVTRRKLHAYYFFLLFSATMILLYFVSAYFWPFRIVFFLAVALWLVIVLFLVKF